VNNFKDKFNNKFATENLIK